MVARPPGIVSQGMGGKTSDRLVTRLCAGGRKRHETIDLHVEPDWKERWLTAFARGEGGCMTTTNEPREPHQSPAKKMPAYTTYSIK